MATKSILKTIYLKSPADVRRFVKAMNTAETKSSQEVVIPHKVSVATKEEIRAMFGKT